MQNYLDLLQHIIDHGTDKTDRTGTGTRSVFGYQLRYDLSEGFPLVTTKKVHLKSIIYELLWFLKGDTNINSLTDTRSLHGALPITSTGARLRSTNWAIPALSRAFYRRPGRCQQHCVRRRAGPATRRAGRPV